MLKKIIHKQHLRLSVKSNKEYNSDISESESEYDSEEEYSDEEEDFEEKKEKYKNHTLKKALRKYNQDIPEKKIDHLFVEMEITPKSKITKELLVSIINYLKK